MSAQAKRFFGTVALAGTPCCCGAPPRAVFALNTPEEGAGVVWLCGPHGDALAATGAGVQSLTRTCGADVNGLPCGTPATAVAIVGVAGHRGVHAVSVCAKHRNGWTGS